MMISFQVVRFLRTVPRQQLIASQFDSAGALGSGGARGRLDPCSWPARLGASLLLIVGLTGCSGEKSRDNTATADTTAASETSSKTTPHAVTPAIATDSPATSHGDANHSEGVAPAEQAVLTADRQIEQVTALVTASKFEEAEAAVGKLELSAAGKNLSETQRKSLADLKGKISTGRTATADASREMQLKQAREHLSRGKYEEALASANEVLKSSPTADQRASAMGISAEIENRRKSRRLMRAWLQLLGSSDPSEVRAAQSQLLLNVNQSLPLVLEAVQSEGKPKLVTNSLEFLRRAQRPAVALTAMMDILRDEKRKENWGDVAREIPLLGSAGAGKPLLDLVLTSQNAEQRRLALKTLAAIPDPPTNTLLALSPVLMTDGPELADALQAAWKAVNLHRQFDLAALRGLEFPITVEEEDRLARIPARLTALMTLPANATAERREVAQRAQAMAVVFRLATPQPFTGLKIATFSGQEEDGLATAVIDGVWDKIDLKTMWRHSVDKRSTIVIDLGSEKTVAGVRIWNWNQQNGVSRGWKDVDVFVSDNPSALTPNATGTLPMAPGAEGTPDYSTVIPVPCVRGRYVKLQAKSIWIPDTYTGITEVQILGF